MCVVCVHALCDLIWPQTGLAVHGDNPAQAKHYPNWTEIVLGLLIVPVICQQLEFNEQWNTQIARLCI